jgi:hypothetical protein
MPSADAKKGGSNMATHGTRRGIMTRTTLAELLDITQDDLASLLDLPLATAERLAAEPVYTEDVAEPKPGDALLDAFAWGRAVGTLEERYRIVQVGRLIGALQRRLGRTWVRF